MGKKSKFNKVKCKMCIYHGNTSGLNANQIICTYATITGHTCLKRTDKVEVVDSRGDDREHCKLFESGKSRRSPESWQF